eukprot:COSAG01_NODE_1905_length_8940_cov_19.008936_7_plen_58_part_00
MYIHWPAGTAVPLLRRRSLGSAWPPVLAGMSIQVCGPNEAMVKTGMGVSQKAIIVGG